MTHNILYRLTQRINMTRKQQKQTQKDTAHATEDGISVQEIARILGITPVEVHQIEKRALKKLKRPTPALRKLHDSLDYE
jgi:DNA-directed RNA polymerase specialized sigma subunit